MLCGRPCLCLLLCLAAAAALAVPAGPPTTAGEKASAKIVYVEDLVYGRVDGAGLLADVAYPEAKQALPVILSVHGGRWKGGHRRDASSINVKQWAGFGFFAMSIDYRLIG